MFEAVAGSWGSGSAVSVMDGARMRNKNSKSNIGEMTFGEGFCKCCQRQIHWYVYDNTF